MNPRQLLVAGLWCAAALLPQPAAADDVLDFYKGRTVSIVVGHETGTGYDIYARTLARRLGRHVPGAPNVVAQNMVGRAEPTGQNTTAEGTRCASGNRPLLARKISNRGLTLVLEGVSVDRSDI